MRVKRTCFSLAVILVVFCFITGCISGCGKKEEFTIIGSWASNCPMDDAEIESFRSLYKETHDELYNLVSGYEYNYSFAEDGTYTETWQYTDKDGNLLNGPSDGSSNTGDTYYGTFTLDDDVLTLVRFDSFSQPVITQCWSISVKNADSFKITLVKMNDKDIKNGLSITFSRTE